MLANVFKKAEIRPGLANKLIKQKIGWRVWQGCLTASKKLGRRVGSYKVPAATLKKTNLKEKHASPSCRFRACGETIWTVPSLSIL